MQVVKQFNKGGTILATKRPDMCGGFYWSATLLVDAEPMTRGTWHDGTGSQFPDFHDVFGRLGYRTIPMERIYYSAAHHAARM